MSTLVEAVDILRTAEERLRGLITLAASRSEYDALLTLAAWAKQLHAIWEAPTPANGTEPHTEVSSVDFSEGSQSDEDGTDEANQSPLPAQERMRGPTVRQKERTRPARAVGKGRRTTKVSQEEYPRFLREGDSLIKIGWSKSDKRPYEHRAPRRILGLLVAALQRAGEGGVRFAMESILPLRDQDSDEEVPAYQAYLTLAWLRKENLIVQHGRQGYSLPPDLNLTTASDERWQALATR